MTTIEDIPLRNVGSEILQSTPKARNLTKTRDEVRAAAAGAGSPRDREIRLQRAIDSANDATQEQAAQPPPDPIEHPSRPGVAAGESESTDSEQEPSNVSESGEFGTSFEEFAAQTGQSTEALMALTATVDVDGDGFEVTLSDLVEDYRGKKRQTQKAQELARVSHTVRQRAETVRKETTEAAQRAQVALHAAKQAVAGDLQRPEIHALRTSDPAQYIAWQQHVAQRQAALDQQISNLSAEFEQRTQAAQKEAREHMLAHLTAAIPDFDTPARADKIVSVLEDMGVERSEMAAILDPRIFEFASAFADMRDELAMLRGQIDGAKKTSRKVAEQAQSVRGTRSAPNPETGSRKRIEKAKANQAGKRGRQLRTATAEALLVAMQEGRRRR